MRARQLTVLVVLTVAVVGCGVAPFVGLAGAAPATSSTSAASTSTMSASGSASIPDGFVTIPDDSVSSDLPSRTPMGEKAQALREAGVHTSAHADTMEVIVTNPGRAENRYDGVDLQGDGSVAIVLQDDENHDGREVALPADELADALGHRPRIVEGYHDSGEQWSAPITYQDGLAVFDVARFSENAITFSGTVSLSGSQAEDGTTFDYEMADTESASDFTATLTGSTAERDRSADGSSSTGTIDVGGALDPTDQSLSVDVDNKNLHYDDGNSESNSNAESEWSYSRDVNVSEVTAVNLSATYAYDEGQNYPDCGDVSSDEARTGDIELFVEGESWGTQTIDGAEDVSFSGSQTVSDGTLDMTVWMEGTSSDSSYLRCAQNIEISGGDGATVDVEVGGDQFTTQEGEAIDPGLSKGGNDLSIDSPFDVSWSASWTERSPTTDPSIEVNGETVGVDGTLSDGETADLDVSADWLREGTNTVNVSTGTAGGLQTVADLDYSHTATSNRSVSYDGEAWAEGYNVSRTWSSDQSDATLTIPFASDRVVEIGDLAIQRDGDGFVPLGPSSYSLDGSELTVDIGAVDAGETVAIRASGTKVRVENGAIDVLQPTVEGDVLQTKVELTSVADGFGIDVSGTELGDWLHYADNPSWQNADPYVEVDASGSQYIRAPGASDGATATVRTTDLQVTPESGSTDVAVENPSEPRFTVERIDGNAEIEYHDTVSGERYVLWSTTRDTEVDAATAESPVTFRIGESDTYLIDADAGGGGGGGGAAVGGGSSSTSSIPIVLTMGGIVASVLASLLITRRFGIKGRFATLVVTLIGGSAGVVGVEAVTQQSVLGRVLFELGQIAQGGLGAVIVGPIAILAMLYVNRRFLPVPWYVQGIAVLGVTLWVSESIAPGTLTSGLSEVSAAIWVIGLIGAIVLAWRRLKPREINVLRGGS